MIFSLRLLKGLGPFINSLRNMVYSFLRKDCIFMNHRPSVLDINEATCLSGKADRNKIQAIFLILNQQ